MVAPTVEGILDHAPSVPLVVANLRLSQALEPGNERLLVLSWLAVAIDFSRKGWESSMERSAPNKHVKGTDTDGTPAKQAAIAGIEFAARLNHDNRAL